MFANLRFNFISGRYINYQIYHSYRCCGKKGSFGFAEALALCVGAKLNVPLVRLAKIVFKKVRWGKK